MYVHGELLLPDRIAIALLITAMAFLLSCVIYGAFDVVRVRLRFGLGSKVCSVGQVSWLHRMQRGGMEVGFEV